ncbi:MAG: citrate/2-methylcitrate synthase [Armatimonadota bacterium]
MIAAKGLEDVIAGTSSICDVNGQTGQLIYRGYDIDDLARYATFEEVAYLLWFGKLPNKSEYQQLCEQLSANRELPEQIIKLLYDLPMRANPMHLLRTAVSALALYDPDVSDNSPDANLRKAIRLTARIPTIITTIERVRQGKQPVKSKPELSHAANYLYTLKGTMPDELDVRAMDVALILQADHEFNASTFTARVITSTLSDIYSAVVGAIGALAGPLHGGANERVMRMLIDIGEPDRAEDYVKGLLMQKQRVMGFGHRVYKTEDPRAKHLKRLSRELGEREGNLRWYLISEKVEEVMLREKGLYCNVDFYSASVQYMLGIPIDMFTPLFASSRIAGWTAHIMEQMADNRLIRPRAEYVGPRNLPWVPIEQRE